MIAKAKKKSKKKITTPNDMRMPRARNQIFTETENRLLDQITLEITEAWAKDLKVIKACHKKTIETSDKVERVTNLLEKRLAELNDFLCNRYGLVRLKELMEDYSRMKDQAVSISQKKWWEFWK